MKPLRPLLLPSEVFFMARVKNPEVLVLLAAYDGNRYVREQIDSILAQDYKDLLLVLSDDGEKTSDILDEYAERYPQRIIRYRAGKRFGSAKAHFMHLLNHFKNYAPYVMFSDQDDIWNSTKVSVTLTAMKEAEDGFDGPVLVHTDLKVVDANLREISPSFFDYEHLGKRRYQPNALLLQNIVTGCTVMINRELVNLATVPVKMGSIVMHDHWLALIASFLGKIVFIETPTMLYRQHGDNSCGAKPLLSMEKIFVAFKKKHYYALSVQAEAFLNCFADILTKDDIRLVHEVASWQRKGKVERLISYFRNNLWKYPLIRAIGQLIFW